MNKEYIEYLFRGGEPTTEDVIKFAKVFHDCPNQLLWDVLIGTPKLNAQLKEVLQNELRERIPQQNLERSLKSIMERLTQK